MRIKVILSVIDKAIRLPINYNYQLSSLIYKILEQSDKQFSNFLHNKGFSDEIRRFKLFTFSQIKCRKAIFRDGILFFPKGAIAELIVSSPIEEFLYNLAVGLTKMEYVNITSEKFYIKDIKCLKHQELGSREYFRCLSPITVSRPIKKGDKTIPEYLIIDDKELSDRISRNLRRKMNVLGHQVPDNAKVEFIPDRDYVKKRKGKVTKLIDYRGIKIRGFLLPFRLEGSLELIRMAYEAGIGEKGSAGFGMIEKVETRH